MWEGERGRNPALGAPGSNTYTGLIASSTIAISGANSGKAQALYDEDADDLCLRYRPLALSIASKYSNRGVALDDLRSAGLFGLVLASKRFDPDRGIAFGGYAKHWIRGQILELFKLKDGAPGRAVSLDAPNFNKADKHGNTKLDYIIDDSPPQATIDVSNLSDRERQIFGARIEGKTLDEIGKGLGISRERVRQVHGEAVKKVRTKKGNVARACIRDLISRRGYKRPSRRLLPYRSVKYPSRTHSPEEIAAFVASRPDLEGSR